jgi:CRISPR-associated protein Cst1
MLALKSANTACRKEKAMLRYTGHPLVDVGTATIAAFAGKRDPTQLTETDLEGIASYIHENYVNQPLKSFLTVAFTSNAWFSQDAYNPDKPDLSEQKRTERRQKREMWANRHLREWLQVGERRENIRDILTGEPAVSVNLSDKLPRGRAGRAQIPLTLGDECINFYTNGAPGLPISGKTLLCLQAFPLGCAKCGGRLLAVHSDNDDLTYHFAAGFLNHNRSAVQMAQLSNSTKMPDAPFSHRTLLIDTLLHADEMQREYREDEQLFSITAYHLTNSGQGAGLDIYHLPLEIGAFLREMQSADYRADWGAIVRRAWETAPDRGKEGKADGDFKPRRNWLYEDIFDLPGNAKVFLRVYLLRQALRYARTKRSDPRGCYSLKSEADLVSWKITESFLKRIMNMDRQRIDQIRIMGDRLAEYVNGQNDRRFFRDFYTVQQYDHLRAALIKVNIAHVKRGNQPIIAFDPYVEIFEEGDGLHRSDWRLARDLLLIRMVESLHGKGWLSRNMDIVDETPENESKSGE